MTAQDQMPLDLPLRPPDVAREAFMVSDSNRIALDAMARDDWPQRRVLLTGPSGSGKSHLAAIWAARQDAVVSSAEGLSDALVAKLAEAPALVVEDVHTLVAPPVRMREETALFHLLNFTAAEGIPLLMTGRGKPARWRLTTPDLASRLQATAHVEINEPDDALLSSILSKMFADRQMRVGDAVISYLCLRIERTFAAAEDVVDRLDRNALIRKRPITVPLAREVLEPGSGND